MRDVLVLLGASQSLQVHLSQVHTISLDLQRTAKLVPLVRMPVEYSKFCELQSLNVLFPQIAYDTRPSDVYKTLYETLRFLPSTCKTLYFRISLAESKGFKSFLFAFEELLDTLHVGGNDVLYLVDITVCRGFTFRGAFSSLIPHAPSHQSLQISDNLSLFSARMRARKFQTFFRR